MKSKSQKRIFLDYASATPILPEVLGIMSQYAKKNFANPSALYKEALLVDRDITEARKTIAGILKALPHEIVFTGSGTEADNLALFGIVGSAFTSNKKNAAPHIIVSSFEHSAILESAKIFEKNGGKVTYLSVTEDGYIDPEDVLSALTPHTVLVSIMYANNEIGTIQPIKDIAKIIRYYKKHTAHQKLSKKNLDRHSYPLFHTDASQAGNYCSLEVLSLGVDLMTLDSAKVYGPKGIGMLYVKRGVNLSPRIVGGGQEGGRRSGTENASSIIGFAHALRAVQADKAREIKRVSALRDYAMKEILHKVPGAHRNGGGENILPNTLNICFPGADAEFLVLKLDARGIAVSSSSSCQSKKEDSRSKVIAVLGKKGCDASSLRITLGRYAVKSDLSKLISYFPEILK